MATTITICQSKFSLRGFWYYRKHKALFTKRSFAVLLTTATEGIAPRSISVATLLILEKNVWVMRGKEKSWLDPETELSEGDEVVFWMILGNIHYEVQNNKLMLTKG